VFSNGKWKKNIYELGWCCESSRVVIFERERSDSDGMGYGTGIKQRIEGDARFMEIKVTLTLK